MQQNYLEYLRLKLLKKVAEEYLSGLKNFDRLSFEIRSIHSSLEKIEEKDQDEIFEIWGTIEELYAVKLMEEYQSLPKDFQEIADKEIKKLNELSDKFLVKYKYLEEISDEIY